MAGSSTTAGSPALPRLRLSAAPCASAKTSRTAAPLEMSQVRRRRRRKRFSVMAQPHSALHEPPPQHRFESRFPFLPRQCGNSCLTCIVRGASARGG